MRILIINGPNINILEKRNKKIYGNRGYDDLKKLIETRARKLKVEVEIFQANGEGEIIDFIHREGFKSDGIIINAGAYSHYSYAIRDALEVLAVPKISVHISNIHARESFRKRDIIAEVCTGSICGLGLDGYLLALEYLAGKT
ncbi:MAG: type II 3-dehydroquinate dehydratase [Synergistetes bacterium]|nr:type II 3-dehydroquinate dehydratase [Synergistota bacterium]